MGRSVELALEHQETLALEQSQVAQLQELQAVMDGEVAGLAEEMRALQQSIRDGEVERGDGMRQMSALKGQLITASAPLKGRVQEILTVEQHNNLQPLVREGRPYGSGHGAGRAGGRTSAKAWGVGKGVPGQSQGARGGRGFRASRQGLGPPRSGRPMRGARGGWGGGIPAQVGNDGNLP